MPIKTRSALQDRVDAEESAHRLEGAERQKEGSKSEQHRQKSAQRKHPPVLRERHEHRGRSQVSHVCSLLSPSLKRDRFRSDGLEGQRIERQPLTVPDTLPIDARNPSRYGWYWGYAPTSVVRLANAVVRPLVAASADITLAGRTVSSALRPLRTPRRSGARVYPPRRSRPGADQRQQEG